MASKGKNALRLKTFCIVTGASKGLGRCIAVKFGMRFPLGSVMILVARDASKLEKTKQLVEEASPVIEVRTAPMDLGAQSDAKFDQFLNTIFSEIGKDPTDFDQGMIVHNAASLGPVDKHFTDIAAWKDINKYFELNLTSVVALNSIFLKHFNKEDVPHRMVINISSICALQPFKSWSLYCAGKAARDMLFRTMALEDSDVRVLNYAPGPVDTDMQVEARSVTADKELKQMFTDMHANNKLLTCDESITRLVRLMERNVFDSGAHIDYYDL